ncbi:MAG TPA: hypothetical protein VIT38_05435 [Allosphingosinicella sp.]
MSARAAALVAASLLFASSCSEKSLQGEIACQRRMIALTDEALLRPPAPGRRVSSLPFETASRGFEQMPVDGCSDDQLARARTMARTTGHLSDIATRVGAMPGPAQMAHLRGNQAFMEFLAELENLRNRRRVLAEDLDRMVAESR